MPAPEPWLRGILPGLHPVTGHLVRAAQHIREDALAALEPLTTDQLWAAPHHQNSAGFHAKHLAGSTQRLCAYLEGRALTPAEIAAIAEEPRGGESPAQLASLIAAACDRYGALVRALSPEAFAEPRHIGRARIEVTAVSLAIHIAEHGQRHTGQLVSASKLARHV